MKTKKQNISNLWEPMGFRKLQGKITRGKFRQAVPRREWDTELPVTFILHESIDSWAGQVELCL